VADAGIAVPDAMGTAEAINFQPTGGGKAAIAGEVAFKKYASVFLSH
jgi:hypothetical protein